MMVQFFTGEPELVWMTNYPRARLRSILVLLGSQALQAVDLTLRELG
jgi:hypothetical protein